MVSRNVPCNSHFPRSGRPVLVTPRGRNARFLVLFGLLPLVFGASLLLAARKTVAYCQRDAAGRAFVVVQRRGWLGPDPAVSVPVAQARAARLEQEWVSGRGMRYPQYRSVLETRAGERVLLFGWTFAPGDHAALIAQTNDFLARPTLAAPFGYEQTDLFRNGSWAGGALVAAGVLWMVFARRAAAAPPPRRAAQQT